MTGSPVRVVRSDRDLTKGSIIGNLWTLSWPMTISSTIMMLGPAVDMIWIGKLGPASIAGVGISAMVVMVINSLMMGLFMGLRAMVARFVGAGDNQAANHVSQQAFVISIVFSIFMAVIGLFLAEPILMLLGVEADVVTEGAAYMRIQLIGMFTMSFGMVLQSIMQASGDALTPMKISIGTRLFHVALCPFLIFGWWIFPQLGVSGAALTNVITHGVGGVFAIWVLFSGRTRLRLTLKNYRFDGNAIWRMVKIGIPASVMGMQRSLSDFILTWFIVPYGTAAVAAHSLITRVDTFVFMPAMGLGQAAGVLAGQNLGAGKPERSARTTWLAAALFTSFMIIGSLIMWFWAEPVVRIFNADPGLVEVAGKFLRIQIGSYLVYGVLMVLMNCLMGMGDTFIPMLINVVTMWGMRVPLAHYLPQITDLGVYGIRWAMVIDAVVGAVCFVLYFRLGRWKHKKI